MEPITKYETIDEYKNKIKEREKEEEHKEKYRMIEKYKDEYNILKRLSKKDLVERYIYRINIAKETMIVMGVIEVAIIIRLLVLLTVGA